MVVTTDKDKKTKTDAYVFWLFMFQIILSVLIVDVSFEMRLLLLLASRPFWIWPCVSYARKKGYSKWLGLVGVLGILGVILLYFFRDRHEGYEDALGVDPEGNADDMASQVSKT